MHGERGEVVLQAGDRLGVELAVAGGELAGAAGRLSDGPFAGSLLDVVEDRPERRLDLGLGRLGHLGEHVAAAMDETTLAQARADMPWGTPGQRSVRTSDVPRVKLKRCKKRDVCAVQAGRTGPSLRVQSTRYERLGGCGADENEPLTPTLPGAGRRSNQARSAANGRVGGVAGRATVVTVVVKTVVRSRVAARLRRLVISEGQRRYRSL